MTDKTFALTPPLVSIIISNYNYGRFVRDAIVSARQQDYPSIECIVVDDCSTDNSREVLRQAQEEWPGLKVIYCETNGGQSAATLKGLDQAKGDFILLLDADDVLFEDCVTHHLATHMASRSAVGFSCCDAVQIVGGRVVAARNNNVSGAFRRLPEDPALISDAALTRLARHGIALPAITSEMVRLIPWESRAWPWSTTSSMFFRRDALDLVSGATGLRGMRIGTDNFFAHAINHLTGSLILDLPLVAYRLHGKNGFNKRPPMDHFVGHDRADEHWATTCALFIDDLLTRFGHYSGNMERPERVFEICRMIDLPDKTPGLPAWAAKSRFARVFSERFKMIEPLVERETLLSWAKQIGVPLMQRDASRSYWRTIRGRNGIDLEPVLLHRLPCGSIEQPSPIGLAALDSRAGPVLSKPHK